MMKKRFIIFALALALLLAFAPALSVDAQAKDLDEIVDYEITAEVNEDATVTLKYHIDWLVLDSTSEGPLSWVEIGIPNSHCLSCRALSSAAAEVTAPYAGSYARIDLDREYEAGETAVIEFEIVQDYMYQVDMLAEGETSYVFTPGWFDNIDVDDFTLRWKADKVTSQTPECIVEDSYLTWNRPLGRGERFTVTLTYPNDAYAFDLSKSIDLGGDDYYDYDYDDYGGYGNDIGSAVGGVFGFTFIIILITILSTGAKLFNRSANFSGESGKKITRTKVEYYPVCQGCGSPRPDGANNCSYCGRSFIKSEEIIEEKDIPKEEKELRRQTSDGLYRYSTVPNTFMRVHVVNVPVVRSSGSAFRGGSSSRGGGHSSCAHSSCACAGGGRAGCTAKDFYNTGLKLKQLEKKCLNKKDRK